MRIAALAQELQRRETAESLARIARNECIQAAMAAGLSDKAVSIAAMLNPPRVGQINRGLPNNEVFDVVQPLGVIAVNGRYPCCSVKVRFHGDDAVDPGAVVEKRCPRCKRLWSTSRTVLVSTDRGRVDELHWKVAV